MSVDDEKVLNAILNPNTPFEADSTEEHTKSKYEINEAIIEAKKLEVEGVKAAEANNLKRAIECFDSAIKLEPNWASSYNNRAQALRLSGDIDRALRDLDKAISLSEKYQDFKVLSHASTQKGMILRLNGKDEEALACFEVAANHGNAFAKQQVICLNPYAAMCNKMLNDLFQKIRSGEVIDD